ncbi:unnamed protein product [Acanthoscelides obtectus]|uniref:GTPase Era, mitochondrial n=1 Tax=Acanthoscelides obtectus TaxID=200917 RepID=A0A9P0LFM8_ACAOB|nr:unnamed protein product [Acanthoscelides obtectus]CAK1634913.1 GTPase Era, mitochondrial [Acanthoscelides obtectus]
MMYKQIRKLLQKSDTFIFQIKQLSSNTNEIVATGQTEILPACNSDSRLLKVAVIGMPNAGKSTFINYLMDRKVCPSSAKVHTTRGKARAIFTQDNTQIVFMDTPGIVSDKEHKKFNLEKTFIRDSKNVSRDADMIGIIHDVTNFWTRDRLDMKIIKLLEYHKSKPSFLIFNKIDALKSKRKLLDLARLLTENCLDGKPMPGTKSFNREGSDMKGWPYFQDIFMVSALTGDGLEDVRNYLISKAQPGEWLFPEQVWTDQSTETIITNTVKAKLLDFIPQEIPYNLKPCMEYFNVDETVSIAILVFRMSPWRISTSVLLPSPVGEMPMLVDPLSGGSLSIGITQQNI